MAKGYAASSAFLSWQNTRVKLTPEGAKYAVHHAYESVIARVALGGYGQEWPDGHVTAAINAVNREAAHRG